MDDIALLRLKDPVPESVASPTSLAHSATGEGSEITIFGYGCTERARRTGSGTKRAYATVYDRSFNLCPGDSGGPVVLGSDGPILLINSAYYTRSGKDIFAQPYRWRDALEEQITNWAPPEPVPAEIPPEPVCLGAQTEEQSPRLEPNTEGDICAERESWFQVELQSSDTLLVDVRFIHENGDIDMSLHDSQLRRLDISQGVDDQESIEYRARSFGTYYVRVFGYAGAQNQVQISMDMTSK